MIPTARTTSSHIIFPSVPSFYITSISGCGLRRPTWLFLPGFGQVGNTGVWAHEDITGVQVSLQKVLLGFTDVDASKGRLWEGVGWDECKAVQANLVDTVDGLGRR